MRITYYGHSCFLVEFSTFKILFDPFITPNELASDVNIDKIEADHILVSHGHEDHIADVERIFKNTNAKVVSTFEVISYFEKKGIDDVHPMNHGGKWKFDFGMVKMVNAVHSSSFPDGSYAGQPAGFIIEADGKTFYYAGDTALHQDMKQIAEEYDIDFAFLPIGNNFTMDVLDGLRAADYVGTSKIIGMHYDTFPYIEIDHDAAVKAAQDKGKELILLEIGKSLTL